MPKLEIDAQCEAVDRITDAMFSLDFLHVVTTAIIQTPQVPVGALYEAWLKSSGSQDHKLPLSLGIVLGYLSIGIGWAREVWEDLLPRAPLSSQRDRWGLAQASITDSKRSDPTVFDVVRRLRNAIGHARVTMIIPETITPGTDIFAVSMVRFEDVHPHQTDDTFSAEMPFSSLFSLVKALQAEIHSHVRARKP